MDYKKFKTISFIIFGVCTLLLLIISLLGVWEIVSYDIAYKSMSSLAIIGFSFLFVFVIGQKLFENK